MEGLNNLRSEPNDGQDVPFIKEPKPTRKRVVQVSNAPLRKSSRIATATSASGINDTISDNDKYQDLIPAQRESRRKPSDNGANATVNAQEDLNDDEDALDSPKRGKFLLDGVTYSTYQEMVQAKRERNQKYLEQSGLLEKQPKVSKRRVLAPPTTKTQPLPRRQSNRLAGKDADNVFIEKEGPHGKFEISGLSTDVNNSTENNSESLHNIFYRNRINDGSDLSIAVAVSNLDSKWSNYKNIHYFEQFIQSLQSKEFASPDKVPSEPNLVTSSPTSVRQIVTPSPVISAAPAVVVSSPLKSSRTSNSSSSWTIQQINALSGDDESCIAKVCPDRIYGIAIHPGIDRLIVSAGDKIGNIGIWNVDNKSQSQNSNNTSNPENCTSNGEVPSTVTSTEEDIGIYMFKYHTGAAACLQWTSSGNALMSTSYDGTVRWLDIEKQVSEQIFATYDDSDEFKHQLGYGLDIGYRYWTQYGCLDHRSGNDKCMFLSTSVGTAMHLDLRTKGRITFHEELSDKKINSMSLHPNGFSLLTGGLDNTVRVWDIRNFGNMQATSKKSSVHAIAECNLGKSVNSIFFSPSGQHAVATTMANRIEVFNNLHLVGQSDTGKMSSKKATAAATVHVKPSLSKYHDNNTGRWLTTFMGVFHPSYDLLCIGSMQRPRCIELFDPSQNCSLIRSITGDAVTSVSSRCCFHPRTDRIVLAGGNSSGRITVIR